MGSLTKGQRDLEENIKASIVRDHRAGLCDASGNPYPKRVYGCGHTNRCIWPGLPGQKTRFEMQQEEKGDS
jgi:hypothetical protein